MLCKVFPETRALVPVVLENRRIQHDGENLIPGVPSSRGEQTTFAISSPQKKYHYVCVALRHYRNTVYRKKKEKKMFGFCALGDQKNMT